MSSFRALIEDRDTAIRKARDAKQDQNVIETKIVEEMVRAKMFDMFSVNWRKLNAAVYGKRARKGMEQAE